VKEIQKDGSGGSRVDQALGFECAETTFPEMLAFSVEQMAIGSADTEGQERLLEFGRLEENGESCQGSLLRGSGTQRCEGGPELLLVRGVDRDAQAGKDRYQPFAGPGAFALLVDMCQGMQLDVRVRRCVTRVENLPVTAAPQGGSPHRAAEIECEHLRIGIAAELEGHQGQQYRLARTCGPDHKTMSDIPHVQR